MNHAIKCILIVLTSLSVTHNIPNNMDFRCAYYDHHSEALLRSQYIDNNVMDFVQSLLSYDQLCVSKYGTAQMQHCLARVQAIKTLAN